MHFRCMNVGGGDDDPEYRGRAYAALLWILDVTPRRSDDANDRRRTDPPAEEPRLCWHCCHTWTGPAIGFPVSYDPKRNTFKIAGHFCSWECLRAYNRDSFTGLRNSLQNVNIRHYYKMITGNKHTFKSAPPRCLLKSFGGDMSIREFRDLQNTELSYYVIPGSVAFVSTQPLVPAIAATEHLRKPIEAKPVDFGDAVSKIDNLRLKRPKPLQHGGRNGLERALGLNSLLKQK